MNETGNYGKFEWELTDEEEVYNADCHLYMYHPTIASEIENNEELDEKWGEDEYFRDIWIDGERIGISIHSLEKELESFDNLKECINYIIDDVVSLEK